MVNSDMVKLYLLCLCFIASLTLTLGQDGNLQLVPGESVKSVEVETKPSENSALEGEFFEATHEWKTIKPGQRVPSGLHYRLNMETGENEAKLLPGQDPGKYRIPPGNRKGPINIAQREFTVKELLEQSLKDLNDPEGPNAEMFSLTGEPVQPTMEQIERERSIKSEFKDYDELKKDYESMKAGVKSDLQIIREMLAEYRASNCSEERRLGILDELEYYLHQIDNAVNFVGMNGLDILRQAINHTSPEFRQRAAFVVGSAAQSNPEVQVSVVDQGIMHHIIRSFVTEPSTDVQKKYIYALSSLLRHFPFAQKKFLELGGLELVVEVFGQAGNDRLKVKWLTLLDDLVREKKNYESLALRDLPDSIDKERLRQYRDVPLLDSLVGRGWCSLITRLLSLSDWDSQEKVLLAMDLMFDDCKREFVKSRSSLIQLQESYRQALDEDAENDYVEGLLRHVETMQRRWSHEEL